MGIMKVQQDTDKIGDLGRDVWGHPLVEQRLPIEHIDRELEDATSNVARGLDLLGGTYDRELKVSDKDRRGWQTVMLKSSE